MDLPSLPHFATSHGLPLRKTYLVDCHCRKADAETQKRSHGKAMLLSFINKQSLFIKFVKIKMEQQAAKLYKAVKLSLK